MLSALDSPAPAQNVVSFETRIEMAGFCPLKMTCYFIFDKEKQTKLTDFFNTLFGKCQITMMFVISLHQY